MKNRKIYIDIMFYIGAILLTFQFVDIAISPGMFSFFDMLSNRAAFFDMVALWVFQIAVLEYVYSDNVRMQMAYITAGIVAELVLTTNQSWGALLLMLLISLTVAVVIMPLAERMKRVLQCFFGSAFILCNMSLLYGYVEWIQIENVSYSMETSIVAELALSILALYVMREWEKIPEECDLAKVRLCSLQRGIKRITLVLIVAVVMIGFLGYDMGIAEKKTQIAFIGENGEAAETGIFVNTAVSLLYQATDAFQTAFSQNLIGSGYKRLSLIGAGMAILVIGMIGWLLYRGYRAGFEGKTYLAVLAFLELIQLLWLPIAWEMVLVYAVLLFVTLREYVPSRSDIVQSVKQIVFLSR